MSHRLVDALQNREDVVAKYPDRRFGEFAFGPKDIISQYFGDAQLPPIESTLLFREVALMHYEVLE